MTIRSRAVHAAAARHRRSVRRGVRLGACLLGSVAFGVVIGHPIDVNAATLLRRPSSAAIGSIGIRLVDGQAAAPRDPRAGLYIVDHLAPGAVIKRHVEVSNTTGSSRHVEVYPAAAGIAHGSFTGAADRTPNDLSTWISLAPGGLDIPAGGRRGAMVTITVPRDAAPGEQYGIVWAEARSAPTAGGGIVRVSRVGVRVYLSVGPGGPPPAAFTIDSITGTRSNGRPLVTANVRNTGGRALDIAGSLRLMHGPGGLAAGPYPANLGVTLAIGATERVMITLDKALPTGPWDAHIALHSGLVEHSARTTITFPGVAVRPASNRAGWLMPASVALLLVLLGLAVALALSRRRDSRRVAQPAQRSRVLR